MEPQYRFCTSVDGTRIAYGTYGDGPPLIFANTWVLSMDAQFTWPEARVFFDALAARTTLVAFDRRGTGASKREVEDLSAEAEAGDIAAVADAAGLRAFHLFADATAGAAGACFASTHPERVQRLVLWAVQTSIPLGGVARESADAIRKDWSYYRRLWAGKLYREGPVSLQKTAGRAFKDTVSADMAARRFESEPDLLPFVGAVTSPTLVLHREAWPGPVRQIAVHVAGHLPNGHLQFVPGEAATPYPAHEAIVDAAFRFFRISAPTDPSDKDLPSDTAIILFADIVDSTALTERLGDAAFRDKARELDESLRVHHPR